MVPRFMCMVAMCLIGPLPEPTGATDGEVAARYSEDVELDGEQTSVDRWSA